MVTSVGCSGVVMWCRKRGSAGVVYAESPVVLVEESRRPMLQLEWEKLSLSGVVVSTFAFGSIGHGFKFEHHLFSHH